MSKINNMLCKIFEPDKKGDIDVESVIEQSLYILFWGAVIIIVVGLAISAFIYGIYYIATEEAHSHLFETNDIPPTAIQMIGLISGIWVCGIIFMIIRSVWLTLWDKFKGRTIAHCPLKKEEDESHD